MYFWNIHKLKKRLRERPLTDHEVLPYFIIYVIMVSIPYSDSWKNFNTWDYFDKVVSFLLPILGILYAYVKNNGKEGQHFLQKYLSLGWVLFLRILSVLLIILATMLIVDNFFSSFLSNDTQWFESFLFLAVELFYYYRLGYHMEDCEFKSYHNEQY